MSLIKSAINQDIINYFKEVSGKVSTIHNDNENFTSTNVYEKLECVIDDCCIYLGESGNENYDYSIYLHKIEKFIIEDNNILIKFLNGNSLLIVADI